MELLEQSWITVLSTQRMQYSEGGWGEDYKRIFEGDYSWYVPRVFRWIVYRENKIVLCCSRKFWLYTKNPNWPDRKISLSTLWTWLSTMLQHPVLSICVSFEMAFSCTILFPEYLPSSHKLKPSFIQSCSRKAGCSLQTLVHASMYWWELKTMYKRRESGLSFRRFTAVPSDSLWRSSRSMTMLSAV